MAVKLSAGPNETNKPCRLSLRHIVLGFFFITKKRKGKGREGKGKKKAVLSIYYICWAVHWEEKKFKL